ncbi:TonB-linked outer membrane protein, SusC/RagA family [bacterium A37T11]|nr:TonB-linked outer membrane protein, SusC/RagA family [bacterium A37T11]
MKAKLPSGILLPKNMHFLLQPPVLFTMVVIFLGTHSSQAQTTRQDSLKLKRDSTRKSLQDSIFQLDEVEVSTGYQTLPKERATGSFEVIDQKLFNRNISTNVLDRLDGLFAGATFGLNSRNPLNDRRYFYPSEPYMIQVRGQNTFNGEFRPLIVLDDVIYEGDVRNLNPNDVKEIYLLKDASATSIWGTRAGNGVLVIRTKRPESGQDTRIGLSSNFTLTEKPNLFALPEMSSSDFIDYEHSLFNRGYYDNTINDTWSYPTISPVVELLDRIRKHTLDSAKTWEQINAFRHIDVRSDYMKYIYRPQMRQQYAIDLSGGTPQSGYLISAGFDKNLNQLVTSDDRRLTLRSVVNLQPLKRLQIQSTISYAKSTANSNGTQSPVAYGTLYSGGGKTFWPYLQLADANGNPLVVDAVTYRKSYRDSAGYGHLLNWDYIPLKELDKNKEVANLQDLLLNVSANYRFGASWTVKANYAYELTNTQIEDWTGLGSYAMRETINIYSQWNSRAVTKRPIPLGDQINYLYEKIKASTFRMQVNFEQEWDSQHQLSAIAGAERRETSTTQNGYTMYGYNWDNLSYQPVDFAGTYPLLNMPYGGQRINNSSEFFMESLLDRYLSAYANAAYTYHRRYTISASGRQDASNIFGQHSNQRWTPLWSSGLAWKLSDEDFYHCGLLPYLKLRMTYGYSGQSVNSQSAIPVIYHQGSSFLTGLPYASITSPPNPGLRWQKTGILNAGIDFNSRNNRLSGSVEWYTKHAVDLISQGPTDPTTGFSSVTLNSASITGHGLDITLNSNNIKNKFFDWQSAILFNYNKDVVKKYYYKPSYARDYVYSGTTVNPVKGKDLRALFAFPFAGLEHETGDPLGYLNGEISKNYRSMLLGPMENLKYMGSSIPLSNATLRNTFTYRKLSLSFSIQAKLGYSFFREGFNDYAAAVYWDGHKDYATRWQQPGDEAFTNVPSVAYPLNYYRSEFYKKSDALVVKGDHIRVQDIALSYMIDDIPYIRSLQINAYINNLNILLWRANKLGIDPVYGDALPAPRTFSMGIHANF